MVLMITVKMKMTNDRYEDIEEDATESTAYLQDNDE